MKIMSIPNAQQRIWLEWTLDPESVAYNNPLLYQLKGAVNLVCLERALQQIIALQPAMRSYFITQAGVPKQVITSACEMKLDFHDVAEKRADEKSSIIEQIIANNVQKPFDLTQLPLFRFSLIKVDTHDYLFILNIHHIVVDGFSAQLLVQLISDYYQQALRGEPLSGNTLDKIYCDYIEQSTLNHQPQQNEKDFWQHQFSDANIQIDLFQANISAQVSEEGIRNHFSISKELTQRIKQLSKQYRTTDFIVLMAAFYVVLSKYSNQDDLTIGYPLDIRPSSCRDLFGFFVNNIPFRMNILPDDTLQTLIGRMNDKRKALKAYQKTDLSQIVRYVRQLYPSNPDKLYNVSFIRANFAMTGLELQNIIVVPIPISTSAVKDDLCLLYDEHESFEFEIEFNKQLYSTDYIEKIQASYEACLQAFCLSDQILIAKIPIFEREQMVSRGKKKKLFRDNLISRFINHVKISPDQIAIVTSEQTLNYQQLYQAVIFYRDIISAGFIRKSAVVVCMRRSPRLLAVLLAVQSLEITYIPIDPSLSMERIKSILEDSQASAFIYDQIDESLFKTLPSMLLPILPFTSNAILQTEYLNISTTSENYTAYIIYTSGSTGKPKGVAVGRDGLSNFLGSMGHRFMQEENATMLAITTISFDISGLELYLPIWQQRTVFIADQEQHKDPFMLKQILNRYPITHLQATPAMWQMLGETDCLVQSNLIALCGGEALSVHLAEQLRPNVRELWNMYGPTETTIWCSLKQIQNGTLITVGKPIDNMEMYVLDASHHPLPPYVKGELYIGGVGLAEGYVNNEVLTNTQFIQVDASIGGRLYRTGDVACTTSDGEFIIFGRTDNQIKLNGYRIELGEIESRLLSVDGVLESAVLVHQNQLIAFVSMKHDAKYSEADLLDNLSRYVPAYMLPTHCLILEKLPLTVGGKIDRKALPLVDIAQSEVFEKPIDEIEARLLTIWQLVLQKERISVTANFYSLGGHSLLAVQLTVEINKQFNTQQTLANILRHPSIREQSRLLKITSVGKSVNTIVRNQLHKAPLSSSQQRIWFISQLLNVPGQFNMAATISIQGAFDNDRFLKAMDALVQRHEPLRTMISVVDHQPHQLLNNDMFVTMDLMLSNELSDWIVWAAKPFNELAAPLWRICLHQINPLNCIIGLSIHHLIADGYSVPLLLTELWSVYDSGKMLAPLPYTYMDYSIFESKKCESEKDIQFWIHELLNCPYLSLPHDVVDNKDSLSGIGAQYISTVSIDTWKEVQRYCEKSHLSVGTLLLGAFGLLMHHYSQQTDFCIGLPVANREHAAMGEMIGCFMDLIPIRMNISNTQIASEWLRRLEGQLTECLSHNSLSFSSMLTHLTIERSDTESPLFPIVLNIQADLFKNQYSNQLDIQVKPIHTGTSKYDLSLEIYVSNDQLSLQWEFSTSLFTHETIKKMSDTFEEMMIKLLHNHHQLLLIGSTFKFNNTKKLHATEYLAYRAPKSDLEKRVALVWEKVLNQKQVGLDDHFFRLGGHSFLAAQVISQLSEELNTLIPIALVFKHSQLVDFCEAIDRQLNASDDTNTTFCSIDTQRMPLTANQRQIVLSSKEGGGDLYHISVLVEFDEVLQISRLESVFNQVMTKHTIYYWQLTTDINYAQLASFIEIKIDSLLLDHEANIFESALALNRIPIAIGKAPLLRVTAFSGKKNALLITVHHIIADERSLQCLAEEVLEHYYNDVPSTLTSNWQSHLNKWLEPRKLSESYWREYLKTVTQSRLVPTRVEGLNQEAIVAFYQHRLSASMFTALAHQHNATPYHVSLALFIYLVDLVSLDDEISFALTFDRRQMKEEQDLHGYLVNLLQLKTSNTVIGYFADLIQWVKSNNMDAVLHSDVDYASLMERGLISKPEIVFNFQHTLDINIQQAQGITWHAIASDRAKFSLVFNVHIDTEGVMDIKVEYQSSLYHADFIQSLVDTYEKLSAAMYHQIDSPMRQWSLVKPSFSTALPRCPVDALMNQLRAAGVLQSKRQAIHYGSSRISYTELWRDVDTLSKAMLHVAGAELSTDTVVAVVLANKYQYIVSILALLQVGAIFLPIDNYLPLERQKLLIEDSHATYVIHDSTFNLPKQVNRHYLIDDLLALNHNQAILPMDISSDAAAYLIYTSGTTGVPKATVIIRSALLEFIEALQKIIGITATDHILQFSSVSFDASIWEIFIALYNGASLFIPDEKERRVGQSLQMYIQKSEISHAILTPTVLNTLDPSKLPSLRIIASGGEACTPHLMMAWTPYCDFYNAYGPTEATVCVAINKCNNHSKASIIGEPLGKAKLWVSSPLLKPQPIGVVGELMIGGPILARCYLNQVELTAVRFVVIDGERWYRSGDQVRQIAVDQFEYFGRMDRQIKLRGLRIELGEIESKLILIPNICAAHCLVDQEQLFAYITATLPISGKDILAELSHHLPNYLLPNRIIQVDVIPLLPSGKIDLSQLIIPTQPLSEPKVPRNETELQLHALWCKVLQLTTIDIESDFFAIGGNSLQAMVLAAEIESIFSIEFSIQLFYSYGSIALQHCLISEKAKDQEDECLLEDLFDQLSESEKHELLRSLES